MKVRGQYQIELFDDIIAVTFEGMFNLATSREICQLVERHIEGLNGQRFFMLIDLTQYQGSTPDAHKEGNRHAQWLEQQNCGGKAIVINEHVWLNIIRNEQDFLKQSAITTKSFESKDDAKTWLRQLD